MLFPYNSPFMRHVTLVIEAFNTILVALYMLLSLSRAPMPFLSLDIDGSTRICGKRRLCRLFLSSLHSSSSVHSRSGINNPTVWQRSFAASQSHLCAGLSLEQIYWNTPAPPWMNKWWLNRETRKCKLSHFFPQIPVDTSVSGDNEDNNKTIIWMKGNFNVLNIPL